MAIMQEKQQKTVFEIEWVNLSKRGGKDGVFRGLAGLHWGISRGQSPREIPRSSPASPRKTPSFPTLLLRFTFYFQHGFSKYWGQQAVNFFWKRFQLTSDDKLQILTQLSFHKFVVQKHFVITYFVAGPLWKVEKSSKRLWQVFEQVMSWIPYFFFGPIF